MRSKLGLVIMEDADGGFAVQPFADPDAAARSFAELRGHPGEKPRRATFLDLRYEGGAVRVSKAESRDLPVEAQEPPNRYVIGEGPKET